MVATGRFLAGLALLWWCAQSAQAFPRLTLEREPNSTLNTAQEFHGEARLIGQVVADDQDLYRWRLGDDDLDHLWRFQLLADDGASVSVEVTPFPAQAQAGIATFGSATQPEQVADDTPLLSLMATQQRAEVIERGLLIPAADYLIRLAGQEDGGGYQLVVSREAALTLNQQRAADEAPQHDDSPPQSPPQLPPQLTIGEPAALRLDPGESQQLTFQVSATSPPLTLHIDGDEAERLGICLFDDQRHTPTCRHGANAQLFEDAALPAGDYRVVFEPPRRGDPIDITVSLEQGTPLADDQVSLPNYSADWAYPIAPMDTLTGQLGSDDDAWFMFDLGAERRQWQIQAQSDTRLSRLELYQPERLAMDTLTFNALFPGEDRATAHSVNSET